MCVVINEAFTIASAVQALNQQALDESHCGIWFNVTLLPPGVSVHGPQATPLALPLVLY